MRVRSRICRSRSCRNECSGRSYSSSCDGATEGIDVGFDEAKGTV